MNPLRAAAQWTINCALSNPRLDAYLRDHYLRQNPQFRCAPPGHYYSPLPNIEDVRKIADQHWQARVDLDSSLVLNPTTQLQLLEAFLPYYPDFDWSNQSIPERRYRTKNTTFETGDALSLFYMLRHFRPKHVIEIGSGFSSALMLDTNDRFHLDINFTFIDPELERLNSLLRTDDSARAKVIQSQVQSVPLSTFNALEENDILFIDSSHVSKVGSDLNHELFEIIPRLRTGVLIHFHDIFDNFEYPLDWILKGVAWNEDYLIRAFLQYNTSFHVLLFNSFAGNRFRNWFAEQMPRFLENTGGSLWLRKVQ